MYKRELYQIVKPRESTIRGAESVSEMAKPEYAAPAGITGHSGLGLSKPAKGVFMGDIKRASAALTRPVLVAVSRFCRIPAVIINTEEKYPIVEEHILG
jgi:hypothetical protein